MVYMLGGILVVALVIAFIAQSLLSPQRRTRIIFGAEATPSIILLMSATSASGGEGFSWFQIVVSLALALCVFLFAGLVGAIVGSELASLTKRLLHRQR